MKYESRLQHLSDYLKSTEDLSDYWKIPKQQIQGFVKELNGVPILVELQIRNRRHTGAEFLIYDGAGNYEHIHAFRGEVEKHKIEDEYLQALLRFMFNQAEKGLENTEIQELHGIRYKGLENETTF